MGQQCKCKRGHASLIDGKCSNCRTKKEQEAWLKRPSKELTITIVNKHHNATGEYIGRGSPLGNPFPITPESNRETVIGLYEEWLQRQIDHRVPRVLDELQRLGGLVIQGPVKLQCFCAPAPCHGDVIKRVLFDAISRSYPETHWWIK